MNRIELAAAGPAATLKGQAASEGADATQGNADGANAFKSLLRHLSGADRGGKAGSEPAEKQTQLNGRAAIARHGGGRGDAGKSGKADEIDEARDPAIDADGARPVLIGAEPTAGQALNEAPIVWPDALLPGAPTAASGADTAATDERPSLATTMAGQIGRAVSDALAARRTGPAASAPGSASTVASPGSAEAKAAVTAKAGAAGVDSTSDPFAVLNSVLPRDEPELNLAVSEPHSSMPKLSIIAQETHFEPVQRLSPVQQIATSVLNEVTAIADTGVSSAAATSVDDGLATTRSNGPLRVLHIKLEPDDLGAVVLRMRLVGDSLELHLEASRAETAHLLEKDKDMLVRVLRASGYTPDVVTVQTATASDSTQSQSGRAGGQGQPSGSGASQNPSQDSRSGDGRNPSGQSAPSRKDQPHDDAGASRSRGDLYL